MEIFTAITAIFGLLLLLATPSAAVVDWEAKCANKAPEVVAAIGRFCTMAGHANVVPRKWTENGVSSIGYPHNAHVSIGGYCKPKQWVPKGICFKQLYKMCVHGDKDGNHGKRFGRNICQSWWITHP